MDKKKLNVLRVTKYRNRKKAKNACISHVQVCNTEPEENVTNSSKFCNSTNDYTEDHVQGLEQNEQAHDGLENSDVHFRAENSDSDELATDGGCSDNEYCFDLESNDDEEGEYYSADDSCDEDENEDDENLESVNESKINDVEETIVRPEDFDEITELRNWLIDCGIYQSHGDRLLRILRRRLLPDLPKSCKTFLKTDSADYHIEEMEGGKFVYYGILKGLQNVNVDLHEDTIDLIINIDGASNFNSSTKQMWPILGKIFDKYDVYKPFPIAIYYGEDKPKNITAYFERFVDDVNNLNEEGFEIDGNHFKIAIKCFCCDTPARALVKGVKGHNGFFSCERCTIRGTRFDKRTIFPLENYESRTDASFRDERQPEHHNYESPLLNIVPPIDMIKSFILDFMHLCCLGIMKTLLDYWLGVSPVKLSRPQKIVLEKRFENIMNTQVPLEYQRKTKHLLKRFSKLKATECRFFLLYSGPILMKKLLKPSYYRHFLLLHAACRLLSSDECASQYCEKAKLYLRKFVESSELLYGKHSLTKNMHNLLHLADDVKSMGCSLSRITCFPFESFLGKIKRMLRSGKDVLPQISRRLHERYLVRNEKPDVPARLMILSEMWSDDHFDIQKLQYNGVTLRTCYPDNNVLLNDGTCVLIEKLWRRRNSHDVQISVRKLQFDKPMFTYPFNSSRLHMWKLQNAPCSHVSTKSIENVKQKLVTLYVQDEIESVKAIYTMPLLHKYV